MPNQEENITADVFSFHIIAIQFIVYFFEACIKLGFGICFCSVVDSTFTAGFAEQSDGCVFQTADPDCATVAGIDGRRFAV